MGTSKGEQITKGGWESMSIRSFVHKSGVNKVTSLHPHSIKTIFRATSIKCEVIIV